MGKRRRARNQAALERTARETAEQAARAVAASTVSRAELTETLRSHLGALKLEQAGRDEDLVAALERVAESYERVADRVDDERRVQMLLAEALVRIEQRLTAIEAPAREPELPRGPRLIGGSIGPPDSPRRLDS